MMVDGLYCTVGSTNLDARSLKCDFEENAVIVDKANEETAETAIQTGIEDYLDTENGKHDCYGDAIEAALSDVNVSYTIFYYPDYDDEREYEEEWEQFANWIAQIMPLKTNHF